MKYEIGNFKISTKYYIFQRRRRYFISWDTSKTAKTIYIHINEVRERDNEVWEWQFHDINEILYRQKKSTIFPIMRYTQKRKKWYIYIYDNKDWARHNQIGDWQLHNINEILHRHKKKTIFHIMRYIPKEQKRFIYIYIYIYETKKIERETNKYEIGNYMISMKYYIAKRRRRYFISWDTFKKNKNALYIYIWKWRLSEKQSNLRFAISRY